MKNDYPDLNSLQAFAVVVRLKSFTAAAAALGVSVATVTRWVNELERERLCKLFSSRKPLRLSVAGERYFAQLDKLLLELSQVANHLDDEMMALAGDINLLAPVNFSYTILADLLIEFANAYPDINVQLRLNDDLDKQLLAHTDLGIVIGLTPPEDWIARQLGQSCLILCATPEYVKKHGLPDTPGALEHHHLVAHGNNLHWSLYADTVTANDSQLPDFHLDIKPRFCVKDMGMVEHAVIRGLGIGNLPRFILQPLLDNNELIQVLPQWHDQPRAISMVYPHREYLPRRVRCLIDFLVPRLTDILNTYR